MESILFDSLGILLRSVAFGSFTVTFLSSVAIAVVLNLCKKGIVACCDLPHRQVFSCCVNEMYYGSFANVIASVMSGYYPSWLQALLSL